MSPKMFIDSVLVIFLSNLQSFFVKKDDETCSYNNIKDMCIIVNNKE